MRKSPRQARSREMVERLVAAGRSALATHGYDGFTTNRVAEAAQVSPGSVYQYFRDKSEILDLIIERYWDEVASQVATSLAESASAAGPTMIRDTADALVAALESDPILLRVLTEELPIAQNRSRRTDLERRVRELLTLYLRTVPAASRRPDPATTAWIVVIALENLVIRWILDDPPFDRDTLLDEVSAMVAGYASVGPDTRASV